ncbi:hypothetical protein J2848_005894 [Azospirillum lipoferum]|uniref:Uncharacterized protein n=1 Tax=Azospirillum lipoferum TaxID=193 RepID=A0A5A9GH55_AZOLI|nr:MULTISPECIES: hypothetical protein [Azospirillum]KAA0593761.1 hypothetical protein FZ942_22995 [Azospirillum lipoferum]MCP1614191.1 hypothetical protein [Azospirillum lipoferum]MDW5536876.1 hypothetical protein [Azospirillum sp. NL1]
MGMSFSEAERILRLENDGLLPPQAVIAELGSQEFMPSLGAEKIKELLDLGKRQENVSDFGEIRYASKLYEALGYSSVSFDLVDAPATRRLDLNTDSVPVEFFGKSDLTTNFGTTEHIINQYNCFKFIHDITRCGGLMWHSLPSSDYYGHGFFKYDPNFFFSLVWANDYHIIDWGISSRVKMPPQVKTPDYLFDAGMPHMEPFASSVTFILQKRFDRPFVPPIDSPVSFASRALFHIRNAPPTGRLLVYGAGGMGQSLVAALQESGFAVAGFIDTYKAGECAGLPIHRFEDYRQQAKPDDRIIIASDFAPEIKGLLSQNGIGWFLALGGA